MSVSILPHLSLIPNKKGSQCRLKPPDSLFGEADLFGVNPENAKANNT